MGRNLRQAMFLNQAIGTLTVTSPEVRLDAPNALPWFEFALPAHGGTTRTVSIQLQISPDQVRWLDYGNSPTLGNAIAEATWGTMTAEGIVAGRAAANFFPEGVRFYRMLAGNLGDASTPANGTVTAYVTYVSPSAIQST